MRDLLDDLIADHEVVPAAQPAPAPTPPNVSPPVAPAPVPAARRPVRRRRQMGRPGQRVRTTKQVLTLPRWATYERGTVFAGVLVLDMAFIGLWWINGHYTAQAAYGIGVHQRWDWLTRTVRVIWEIPVAAWGVHCLISVVEQHTWKARVVAMAVPNAPVITHILPLLVFCAYFVSVLIGSMDVLTTAIGLGTFLGVEMYTPSSAQVLVVVAAEVCAIVPEPLIVALTVMLWFVIFRKPSG